jgi:hypothetical protein
MNVTFIDSTYIQRIQFASMSHLEEIQEYKIVTSPARKGSNSVEKLRFRVEKF